MVDTLMIPPPASIEQFALHRNLLEDLALKILYLEGEMDLRELAQQMRIATGVVSKVFELLRKHLLCEVKGMRGTTHVITVTSAGRARALELLELNQYAGPAPVSFRAYVQRVEAQTLRNFQAKSSDVRTAFSHMVLSTPMLRQLGTALVSGTSVFLYGPTGTGKTSLAQSFPQVYRDEILIPYAVEVEGQILTVYDPLVHQGVASIDHDETDARWVRCHRPCVTVGGELSIEMLDLEFHPISKFYAAPVQMKANNGVLVIDDFGRQRARPEALLNRWTVPLDRRVDYLSLVGGRKVEVPFDLLVVFATNLDPNQLADEAFLRRIHSKIKVDCVAAEPFHEIMRRVCERHGLDYDFQVVEHLIELLGKTYRQPLRPCFPLDIVRQITWEAQYEERTPILDRRTVEIACHNYFVTPGMS